MNASHISLQEDYEVTGLELDTIAQAAWDQPGVLGARMTGAGFGGCAIALVKEDKAADIKEKIKEIYLEKTGIGASSYTANIGAGGSRRYRRRDVNECFSLRCCVVYRVTGRLPAYSARRRGCCGR